VRAFALVLGFVLAAPAFADEEPAETPIVVPSPIPVGFLVAWKPTLLSIRIDSGQGAQFGSDKFQPLRILGRYTTTFFGEKLLARAELEGGQFESDTQNSNIGTNGYDLTARVLGGTATKIAPGFIVTAGAGFITRYQRGRAVGGAPNIGMFGVTSNLELEYRVAPILTLSAYAEGALAPFPYAAEARLGLLSDSSEFRARLQLSMDLTASSAIDIGYDFTRWHAAFTQSTFTSDGALLITAREHALTVGFRWKP